MGTGWQTRLAGQPSAGFYSAAQRSAGFYSAGFYLLVFILLVSVLLVSILLASRPAGTVPFTHERKRRAQAVGPAAAGNWKGEMVKC